MKNFRLTVYPTVESSNLSAIFEYETEAELDAARITAARLLIFIQDNLKVMQDFSNIFVREKLIDGHWEDLDDWEPYDPDGKFTDEY